jgi:glycosyltransferase involved in cell wall biosynthesis
MHVTVLMSVYNGEADLASAINSIKLQSYKDWDLLVVDDGSTDQTFALLSEAAAQDDRISVIRNDNNYGLAYSLNKGLKRARGELIARMDADDVSMPERLECQVEFMKDRPDVDVLGCAVELVKEDGEVLGVAYRPADHAEIVDRMYRETPFFHSSIMARKKFFDETGGYSETMRYSQDAELWFRSYKRFCFHNLQDPLLCYRVQERQSITRTFWAMYAILKGASSNGCLVTKGWNAGLYGLSALLGRIGLHEHRPK